VSAQWAEPSLLHLVALFPALLLAALLLWWRRRRQVAAALGDHPAAGGRGLGAFPVGRALLLLPAAALLGVAAAGPLRGAGEVRESGGDVVLLLDASNSMRVQDVVPDRLERQRSLTREIVDRLGASRVALVAFAGTATVLTPLTTDMGAVHLYLDALAPEVVHQGGSSFASPLRHGLSLLEGAGSMVLISDGESMEPPEFTAAALAEVARRRIPVHTVGIGTAEGGPIPHHDPRTGARRGYKQEPDGREAVSRLDARLLRTIASRTGGTFRLDPGPAGAAEVAALASRGGRGAGEGAPGNRYRWPLALALLLLAADAVRERRAMRGGAS
jgi:Ca-activated chloride channel homolog